MKYQVPTKFFYLMKAELVKMTKKITLIDLTDKTDQVNWT